MSDPIRPAATEFSEALRAWKLRVIEWLGLDPARVFDVDVERDDTHMHATRAWWTSDSQAAPTRGTFDHWDAEGDMDGIIFTGWAHLDHEADEALLGHAGPKPRVMSTEDEIRLRRALAGGA